MSVIADEFDDLVEKLRKQDRKHAEEILEYASEVDDLEKEVRKAKGDKYPLLLDQMKYDYFIEHFDKIKQEDLEKLVAPVANCPDCGGEAVLIQKRYCKKPKCLYNYD